MRIEAIRERSIILNLSHYISSSKIHTKLQHLSVQPTITPKRAAATTPMQQALASQSVSPYLRLQQLFYTAMLDD